MYFLDFSKCTKNQTTGWWLQVFWCSSLVKWSNLTCAYFQMEWFNHQPVIWWNKWFKPNVGEFKPNVGSHVPVVWSIWEMNTNNKQHHSRTFTAILNASLVTSWHPDIPKVCLQSIGPGRSSKAAGAGKSFFFRQDSRMEGKMSRFSRMVISWMLLRTKN